MSQPTESKVIELAKEEALLLAGTAASTHEDAYVDSGTSPPTSERLPEGYVDWAAASHNLPTAYKNWFSDWLSYLSQENLKIDLIRLPRILATLQTFRDHPELHSRLSKCRVPTPRRDSSAVAVSELRRAITPAKCFRTEGVSLRRSNEKGGYRLPINKEREIRYLYLAISPTGYPSTGFLSKRF